MNRLLLGTSVVALATSAFAQQTTAPVGLLPANNLSDVSSLATAQSNIGVTALSTSLSTASALITTLSTSTSTGLSTTNSNVTSLSTSSSSGISTAQSGVSSLSTGLSTTNSSVSSLSTSASTGIANALPLSGGTLTGPLIVPYVGPAPYWCQTSGVFFSSSLATTCNQLAGIDTAFLQVTGNLTIENGTGALDYNYDTYLNRQSAGVLGIGTSTSNALGSLNLANLTSSASLISAGTAPTNSGTCAINTQVGGNTAGSFKANGACAAGTIILTFAKTAPTGYVCDAHDMTTLADTLNQSAYTTTSVTLTGTLASADQVVFKCMAF